MRSYASAVDLITASAALAHVFPSCQVGQHVGGNCVCQGYRASVHSPLMDAHTLVGICLHCPQVGPAATIIVSSVMQEQWTSICYIVILSHDRRSGQTQHQQHLPMSTGSSLNSLLALSKSLSEHVLACTERKRPPMNDLRGHLLRFNHGHMGTAHDKCATIAHILVQFQLQPGSKIHSKLRSCLLMPLRR